MDYKVGDEVLVIDSWHKTICTIDKITPKGNVRLSNGNLYLPSGDEKGSDIWNTSRFQMLTIELKEELRKEKVIKKAIKVMRNREEINYEQATQILNILCV